MKNIQVIIILLTFAADATLAHAVLKHFEPLKGDNSCRDGWLVG